MENTPNTLRIVGAMVDKKQAILILEDGKQLTIKQGDHRLGDLMDKIVPIITRKEVAMVDLHDFSVYSAFEQKTEGLTKFFRIAKDKVTGWFGGKTDTHTKERSTITEEGKEAVFRAIRGEVMTEEHVMKHGQPVDMADNVGSEEVVVAVVQDKETGTKKVIPGVQNLKPHIERAVRSNTPHAVQNFLNRCATFIDQRAHSVDDLMRFLEKGDLPLAEDGSIIAYKMLNYYMKDITSDTFVDCHTNNIKQKVGSYVCVNENLVDLNRRNECSNGLHIARRGYLSSFSGQVCVLCKIDPEDVMVVPHGDPNKVRVKGYHILDVLSDEAKSLLSQNKPMTGEKDALTMVYNAIKGNHIGRIERVQVNGQRGTNVVITPLINTQTTSSSDYSKNDLDNASALDDDKVVGTVDPRAINKKVTEEMTKMAAEKAKETKPVSVLDTLLLDYNTAPEGNAKVDAARALIAFKKAKKKGWDKLGINQSVVEAILAHAQTEATPQPVQEPEKPKTGTKEKKPVSIKSVTTPLLGSKSKPITKAEEARGFYENSQWALLGELKRKSKKSWMALGFTSKEIAEIEKHV